MKTAIKVISDRISILDKYLADTNDDDSPDSRRSRGKALWAKNLFCELLDVVNRYTEFLKSGVNNEDLADKIRELLGQTMIPLVERNKEMISSYKRMIFEFSEKGEAIKKKGQGIQDYVMPNSDREEISYLNTMMIEYDKVKKDTIEYLEEYETGLEEIKELVIGGEAMSIAENINPPNHPSHPVGETPEELGEEPGFSVSPPSTAEYQHEPVVHEHQEEEQQQPEQTTEAEEQIEQIEPFVFSGGGSPTERDEPGESNAMSDEEADRIAEEQMKKLFRERVGNQGKGNQGNNEQFPA